MSTEQPIEPRSGTSETEVPQSGSASTETPSDVGADGARSSDDRFVEETKQQIRGLVREIAQLAQSDVSLEMFFEGFLGRVVSALAAEGGAIWMMEGSHQIDLQYQINLQKTGLIESQENQRRHSLLMKNAISGGQTMLMPPQSGPPDDDEAGNPTDYLLLLGVIKIDQEVQGLVEIFQRPGAGPTTQHGYLRFVREMCEIFGDYLKSRRLKHFTDRQSLWTQVEKFLSTVHCSLDPQQTAYTIVNEGRRLIQCDRVSVALRHGGKYRVEAVSGTETIDRRATTVKDLGSLATAVAATGDPIWYTGSCEDMPPQIEEALQQYVDQSHSKMVAVVPLTQIVDVDESNDDPQRANVVGTLIVENIEDNRVDHALRQRVVVVSQHSGSALANAHEHHSLFLLPLWQVLGKATWIVRARTLPKTLAIVAAVAAVILALTLIQADFALQAEGVLQPEIRRTVWAPANGLVTEVYLTDEDRIVTKGQPMLQLQNTELESRLVELLGNLRETLDKLASVRELLINDRRLSQTERSRYEGEFNRLLKAEATLKTQIELWREKEEKLTVNSPIDGEVVTWKVSNRLINRTVQPGQELLTVVDPNGLWELELHMRGSRMGDVGESWLRSKKDGTDLEVTYILASHPNVKLTGKVVEVHEAADVHGEDGNAVLIRVELMDEEQLPDLLHGVDVTAKIHCGRRSIGYVWLFDLISWCQSQIGFWL